MRRNISVPTEHEEQVMLFHWAQLQSSKYPPLALMFAIPNGGKRNAKTAVDLKYEGVKPGVSDIFLPCACGGYHGMFIEMKRTKGGALSAAQRDFISKVENQGYKVVVCKGFEAAREEIVKYLTLQKKESP